MNVESLLFLGLVIGAVIYPKPSHAQNLHVVSYNIRYDNDRDGIHRWEWRKSSMVWWINDHQPDIIGLQEVLHPQLQYLAEKLADYDYYGVGRDDGKTGGEYAPILYRTERYTLKDAGQFWLSESPDKPSKGWDAALPRICTWVLLEEKESQKSVWVFNAHYDHIGKEARINSSKLILQQIADLTQKNDYVLVLGDFNLTPEDRGIEILAKQLTDAGANKPLHRGTWNGFKLVPENPRRIDYIFYTGAFKLTSYEVPEPLTDSGTPLSDHFPVMVYLDF